FVVINIVRDNPSFFVAYFLFTQEFILNQNSGKLKWFDYVFKLICKIISLILCEIAILEIASF
ncbi:hypothetical protein EFR43_03525, partial [Lactobacillus delbrueckii subsp. lactis]|nr:hypothetical protein [Lactobacillus delbrueckii subsp. lactis]